MSRAPFVNMILATGTEEVALATVEYFEHTADVGLRVRAKSLDDLFQAAAEAVMDYIVTNRDMVQTKETETVALQSGSAVDLLADWLNEIIFRVETMHRLYGRFEVNVTDDGRRLDANIVGESIDPDRHILDHEVKAVTQHGLMLEQHGSDWVAELILDI